MKDFLKEAGRRISADTPVFFKKLGKVGAGLAATGTALVTPEFTGAHMPDSVIHIGVGLIAFGAGLKAASHCGAIFDSGDDQTPKP